MDFSIATSVFSKSGDVSSNHEEIMVVGGHLDSWDLGDGAHDDGACNYTLTKTVSQ